MIPIARADAPRRASARSLGWFVRRGLTWGLFALVAAIAILVVGYPAVTGAERYTITGGSMEPAIPRGSMVVVQSTAIDDIRVGDIVTFQLESGQSAVATHRVVGFGVHDGDRTLVTRGDANETADAEPVRAVQIRGAVVYALPWLGWMDTVLSSEMRMWSVPILAGALFVYAGWMFVGAWRDRRRRIAAEPPAPV
ncbi:signal peptidase I [Microbacterium sp. NPDC089189]|uniref:signal peptidase I n=1 Tax=Microbacterium sp. NPDC089189 TaxID=3154972 RepID=UPI003448E5C6